MGRGWVPGGVADGAAAVGGTGRAAGGPEGGGGPGARGAGDGDAVVRWRPGLARTVRGTRGLQLGVGPEACVLEGLTAPDWHLLAVLERGPRRRDLDAALARGGPDAGRTRQLLDLLLGAGVAVVVGPPAGPAGGGRAQPSLVGAEVAVVGGNGLGIALAVALAAAGARTCALVDDATVGPADVLPGGAGRADVGRRSAHVAAEAVHRLSPDVRTACPADPDLVLLVSAQVPDAPAGVPLVQAGTTHLPVVVRPDHVVVGPLVVPGRGACLHCVDLHHSDLDPGWPDAVRLLRREAGRVRVPPVATAVLVVGLAAELATGAGPLLRAGVEVRVDPGAVTSWRRWSPHAACGCVGWPDPGPQDPSAPGGAGTQDPPAPGRSRGATMAA